MALLLLLLSNAVLAGAALLLLFEENDSTAVSSSSSPDRPGLATGSQVTVFFATQKGRSRRFAERLASALRSAGHSASVVDVAGYDVDQLNTLTTAVFILATYEGGTPPPGTEDFFVQLFDAVEDFRVSKASLQQLRYSVFGCGNSEYPEKNFNAAARRTDRALRTLGAVRVARRSDGDEFDNRLDEQFEHWMVKVLPALLAPPKVSTIPPAASVAQTAVGRAAETPADEWESEEEGGGGGGHGMEGLVDLEDLGTRLVGSKGGSKGGTGLLDTSEPKKMVSNSLRKALTKQGYRVVGSHSGESLNPFFPYVTPNFPCISPDSFSQFHNQASSSAVGLRPCYAAAAAATSTPFTGSSRTSAWRRRPRLPAPISASSAGDITITQWAPRSDGRSTTRKNCLMALRAATSL